jgi:hypothetical protein
MRMGTSATHMVTSGCSLPFFWRTFETPERHRNVHLHEKQLRFKIRTARYHARVGVAQEVAQPWNSTARAVSYRRPD